MPENDVKPTTKRTLPSWAMPLVSALVAILVSISSWINANAAKIESHSIQEQASGVMQEQGEFQNQVVSARTSDEQALNVVQERCFQNDRLLRFYAQRIEANVFNVITQSRYLEEGDAIMFNPTEYPSLAAMEEENVETLEEKLRVAYSDDELIEAIRLIELHGH